MMFYLPKSLSAWNTPDFASCFRSELESLKPELLPLQLGMRYSSAVADRPIDVMVLSTSEDVRMIRVKTLVLYSGIVSGCNCSDDPTPIDEQPEQCGILFELNKQNGETAALLLGKD